MVLTSKKRGGVNAVPFLFELFGRRLRAIRTFRPLPVRKYAPGIGLGSPLLQFKDFAEGFAGETIVVTAALDQARDFFKFISRGIGESCTVTNRFPDEEGLHLKTQRSLKLPTRRVGSGSHRLQRVEQRYCRAYASTGTPRVCRTKSSTSRHIPDRRGDHERLGCPRTGCP